MNNLALLISNATRMKAHYWSLIKIRQTLLLTFTGVAGYLCRTPMLNWVSISGLVGSLLFTISGCTALNMVSDRDLDRKMLRTSRRPLVIGQIKPGKASTLGVTLIALGLLWALSLSWLYGILILAGVVLDLLVYTLWLKRRSAWSIFWGGFSGGMPILAASTLAVNRVDTVGLLLCLAIVSWIPSHNPTLGTLYSEDYLNAGVPSFFNVYGFTATNSVISISSLVTALLMSAAFNFLNFSNLFLVILAASGLGLVGMAGYAWVRPSRQVITAMYKYSSLYMLSTMLLLALIGVR